MGAASGLRGPLPRRMSGKMLACGSFLYLSMSLLCLPLRVAGVGAVSPAGWGAAALHDAILRGEPLPTEEIVRMAGAPRQRFRRVPAPEIPLPFLREPRLRRSSPISRFTVAAALEALGAERIAAVRAGEWRLGVVCVLSNGCVNFSRRFYAETLENPATASPLVFPETVFNAPSSHLASLLGAGETNYTLIGDGSQFLAAFDLAAQWLAAGEVDGCLVVGAEELDWLTTEGAALFDEEIITTEGAAAVYVEAGEIASGEVAVKPGQPWLISARWSRLEAARAIRREWESQLSAPAWLSVSGVGATRTDQPEREAWQDWQGPRLAVGELLGAGFSALAGWQCVAAVMALKGNGASGDGPAGVLVSHVGPTQLAQSGWLSRGAGEAN